MSKTTPATLANFSSSATSPHSRSSATTSLTHKWNLTPLFASKQALDTFLKETQKQVLAFEKKYSSSLAKLMPDEFLDSIMQYESLIELMRFWYLQRIRQRAISMANTKC